jgi:hypothetical protein
MCVVRFVPATLCALEDDPSFGNSTSCKRVSERVPTGRFGE